MLLKIVCLLMRWLFGLAVLVSRGDQAKNAELLVLRHEDAALRRNAGRVQYEPADRVWFAALTRFIPRRRWAEDLRAVLAEYQGHYNTARPHQGLGQRVPDPGPAPRVTAADPGTCQIRRKPVLRGLINEYERAA